MATVHRTSPDWSYERTLTRRGVLWLGLRCDVRCTFCYDAKVSTREKQWLAYEDVVTALDKFRRYYDNRFVDFMGGEPTLHPQIVDIVGHAASIGLRPTLITHGMHLAKREKAAALADAGLHDCLVSVHAVGEVAHTIHGRGKDNFRRQMQALENLQSLGVPYRFNFTMIRDNLDQLVPVARLAVERGARVLNFLTFNPYFEWRDDPDIPFQARHSEIAPRLKEAIDVCLEGGVEANVRYMPMCQLRGYERHIYTGFQLPYDPHEWDYNSWYDSGHAGAPNAEWYLHASRRQQARHQYRHTDACGGCAVRHVCDGFHAQYLHRWGDGEAVPYDAQQVYDPQHFIRHQPKLQYPSDEKDLSARDSRLVQSGRRLPVLNVVAGGGAHARVVRRA